MYYYYRLVSEVGLTHLERECGRQMAGTVQGTVGKR